jgi:hypothetical protein
LTKAIAAHKTPADLIGNTDEMIAGRVGLHRRGIEELRQRFVEAGFESALEAKPWGRRCRVLSGEDEARFITLVCGLAPEDSPCWTLKLLEAAWVTLEYTDAERVSRETIRRTLKKTNLRTYPEIRPGWIGIRFRQRITAQANFRACQWFCVNKIHRSGTRPPKNRACNILKVNFLFF